MIVLSPNLILTQPAAVDANSGIIGHHNVVSVLNILSDFAAAANPVLNAASANTFQRWISDSLAVQRIWSVPNYLGEIDYIGIARHNFFSESVQVQAQYYTEVDSNGDPEWLDLTDPFLPADDGPLLFRFDPVNVVGIGLLLTPLGSGFPRIATMKIGKLFVLQRRVYVGHTPITDGVDDDVTNGMSETGEFLGRIITGSSNATSIALQNLFPDWYRLHMRPFIRSAIGDTFFYAWRPFTYPDEVGYCWFQGSPKPRNQRVNGMMEITLNIGGVT